MSGDQPALLLFYGIMVILPLAALVARRPLLGKTLKMVLAWCVIFALGALIVSQRDRLSGVTSLLGQQNVAANEARV